MTQPVRYDLGPCEVETCELEEADLQTAFIMCTKNPGHEEFVPIDKMSREHLPDGYQDSCLMDLIKVLSDLTVRVAVRYTSEDRPQLYPDSDIPFPFYAQENVRTRTGSGWVWNVEKFSQMYDNKTCPCKDCSANLKQTPKWAEIVIASAAHVVFDDKEGKHTTCHLFYDRGSTPETCDGVLALTGMSRVDTNIKEDRCKMTYVTHDMDLADRLENLTKRFVDLQKELNQKYKSLNDSNCSSPPKTTSTRSLSRDIRPSRRSNDTCTESQLGIAASDTLRRTPNRVDRNSGVTDRCQSRKIMSNKLLSRSVISITTLPGNVRTEGSQITNNTSNRSQSKSITLNKLQPTNVLSDRSQSRNGKCDMSLPKIYTTDRTQSSRVFSPDRSRARNTTTERSLVRNAIFNKSHTSIVTSDKSVSSKILPSRNTTPKRSPPRNTTSNRSQSRTATSKRSPSRNAISKRLPSINITSNRSPSRNSTSNRSPSRNATSNRSPSRNATSKRSPSRNATSKRSPSRNATSNRSPSRNATSNRSPSRNATSNRSPSRNATTRRSPSRNATSKRSPSRNATSKRLPSINATSNRSPSRNATSNRSPSRNVTTRRSPSRNNTSRRSPSRNNTSRRSPSRNTTSKRSLSRNDIHDTSQSRQLVSDRSQSRNITSDISHSNNTTTLDRSRSRNITPHSRRSRNTTPSILEPKNITLDDIADNTLTIIVSHPHGCNKQITIGYYIKRVEVKDSRNLTKYVYNTATCPGSSGAPVYVLGRWRGWWPCDHPHSGNCQADSDLNFSGVGLH